MKRIAMLVWLLAGGAVAAEDPVAQGRALYERHCTACHQQITNGNEAQLFTRPDRRVHDRTGLAAQVRRCRDNLGLTLFDDEVEALVRYLDSTHYRFEE